MFEQRGVQTIVRIIHIIEFLVSLSMLTSLLTVFCRRQATERGVHAAHRGLDRGSRRTGVVRSLPSGRTFFRRIFTAI